MQRTAPLALALALLLPAAAEAQPRFHVGAGFTAPNGSISSSADAGYHGVVGLSLTLPTLPLALRGDGFFHRLGAPDASVEDTQVLGGTLSLVYNLPGIGLVPYLLAGLGAYQTEAGPAGAPVKVNDTGYHGGFGIRVGATGVGGFAEIRFVRVSGSSRLIPLTFGLRL